MKKVIVIGAGAAGIAAARQLHEAGLSVTILEARTRIGGRVHTDMKRSTIPVELGAEFIHGENAVTHQWLAQAGFNALPVPRIPNLRWSDGTQPAQPLAQSPWQSTLDGLRDDYGRLGEIDLSHDLSLHDYFAQLDWDENALRMADVLFAQTCCADLTTLSCADLQHEMRVDHAGAEEFRIQEGYSPLLHWAAWGLDIRVGMPVQNIDWRGATLEITANGEIFTADGCLITVPVSLLKRGAIEFNPALPTDKHDAIRAFTTEPATKLIFEFSQPFWDADLTMLAQPAQTPRWWTPGYGRPDAPALIAAYLTAERARAFDGLSDTEAVQVGLQELAVLLDKSAFLLTEHLRQVWRVAWASEPYSLGGYAHLHPNSGDARQILARSEGNRLFFAGEATAFDTNPQTVHGAIESGWRAAQEILATLD